MPTRMPIVAFPIVLLVMGALTGASAPAVGQDSARAVTFHEDVLPLLQKHCQSCHRPGQIGPFSMLTYKETRPWAKAIKAAVVSRAMPPWFADPAYGHFNNDRSLKQPEIDRIAAWVDSGAAEGDPARSPRPIEWPEGGWQIKPDVSWICRRIPSPPVESSNGSAWRFRPRSRRTPG